MEAGFEYNYKQNNDIITIIEKISDFSVFEFSILAIVIACIFIGIYFLFPVLFIMKKYWDRQREKAKRKLMLKQISTQRDIEDEIEAEIEETAQAQAEANK